MEPHLPTEAPNTAPRGLPERLRLETRDLHRQAEGAGVMATLLAGRLDATGYAALLHNLLAIYRALEQALARHQSHPAVAAVFNPALARSGALSDDLAGLLERAALPAGDGLVPATHACVLRLNGFEAHDETHRLVAHAYVRYLGDLSGGQLLRRVISRSPALAPVAGTRFYEFGNDDVVARHLAAFRAGLARLDERDIWSDAIVDEARQSFALHVRLFEELAVRMTTEGDR